MVPPYQRRVTMKQVGKFQKVSFQQFHTAMYDIFGASKEDAKVIYDGIQLPKRATTGSAGYDFKSPISFQLAPGASMKIPTGIRVSIANGWWLCCVPRSSLGFKYRMQLDNTVGVIDSDYFHSDNEGHIFVKVTNDGHDGKTLSVNMGNSFMQGIFLPYAITYDDTVTTVRNGGFGSTDKA